MRVLRAIGCVILLGVLGVVVYEAFAVWRAEARSVSVLSEALSVPQPIRVADLGQKWLEILLAVEDPGFCEHRGLDLSSAAKA